MSKETEKQEFDELYEYVKDVIGYDKKQSLPPSFVLRLKGLKSGKYMENKKVEDKADYPYKVILYTFMYCRESINRSLNTKDFDSENAKFNYILAIVKNSLNDMYLRMQEMNKQKRMLDNIDIDVAHATYKRRTKDPSSKIKNIVFKR